MLPFFPLGNSVRLIMCSIDSNRFPSCGKVGINKYLYRFMVQLRNGKQLNIQGTSAQILYFNAIKERKPVRKTMQQNKLK